MTNTCATNVENTKRILSERGIPIKDLAKIVYDGQKKYYPELTIIDAFSALDKVFGKRECYNALLVAVDIDHRAQQGNLHPDLQEQVETDAGLFGIDETLAISMAGLYGSIAVSNFGHIDKVKPGIIKKINDKQRDQGVVCTMLDDILCAYCACAEAYLASHN